MPTLKIACQGAATLPYTALTEFQGELKSLSKSDFEAMRRQLVENGFSFPIALWVSPEGKNCILDGHQRLRVIRELAKEGWTIPELPVTWVEADNEQQAKEKLLAAAGAFGTVSDQGLYELITSADLDIDRISEMTRFREIDFDVFKEEYFLETPQPTEGLTDPDDVPENVETRVKPGELWILGNHRLLCGDSTKKEDVDRLMNGDKAEIVFTDPPYGLGKAIANDHPDEWLDVLRGAFKVVQHIATQFWWCASPVNLLRNAINVIEPDRVIIWHKPFNLFHPSHGFAWHFEPCLYRPGNKALVNKSDVISMNTVWRKLDPENVGHPTQKPVALAEEMLNGIEGNVIDLFLGSGSTLIACEKTGRRCFGMEIDPHYCDVIIERWEQFTGKKAVKT